MKDSAAIISCLRLRSNGRQTIYPRDDIPQEKRDDMSPANFIPEHFSGKDQQALNSVYI